MLVGTSTQSTRLCTASKAAGYERPSNLARACGMNENTVRSAWNGTRPLTPTTATRLSEFLKVNKDWLLFGDASPNAGISHATRERQPGGETNVAYTASTHRTPRVLAHEPASEPLFIEGSVRANSYAKRYILPKSDWVMMHLPIDPRFPGIPRHALAQVGHDMERVCRPGGTWVYVLFSDLPGQGPSVGQYVIVERERADKTIEVTARHFLLDPTSTPMLYAETDEVGYHPVSINASGPIVAVRIIGRVVDVINRL